MSEQDKPQKSRAAVALGRKRFKSSEEARAVGKLGGRPKNQTEENRLTRVRLDDSAQNQLIRERDNWIATAEQEMRNTQYYRGLVVQIGELFGEAAKTQDDGGKVPDVLCATVPELVKRLLYEPLWGETLREAIDEARNVSPLLAEQAKPANAKVTICTHPIGLTTCGYTERDHHRADGSPMDHTFTSKTRKPNELTHSSNCASKLGHECDCEER